MHNLNSIPLRYPYSYLSLFFYRWVTCCCFLDYGTLAVADKFGNIGVVNICALLLSILTLLKIIGN